MRHIIMTLLLCLLTLPLMAEDDSARLTLPDEPIFVLAGTLMRQHYIWLDNDTFRFTPYSSDNSFNDPIGTDPYEAYDYYLSSNLLQSLDWSPFYLYPNAELRQLMNIPETEADAYVPYRELIPRSPYGRDKAAPAKFLFTRIRSEECNWNCFITNYSGTFFPESNSVSLDTPINHNSLYFFMPYWTSDEQYAIFLTGTEYGTSRNISFLDLESQNLEDSVGLFDPNYSLLNEPQSNTFYALSSEFAPRVLYGHWYQNSSELILWTGSHLGSEECHCMLLPESKTYSLEADEHFSGANFIEGDAEHFLAVAPDGLRRYEVETGDFTAFNPELNSQWIDLAIFSPDNQHVAVIVDSNLYVLPTGIEE